VGWRDGRGDSQREAGKVDAAAAIAVGDDEVQSRRQYAVRLCFELVRCDALPRGRVEAGEDDP
jgi:hypothetical protein